MWFRAMPRHEMTGLPFATATRAPSGCETTRSGTRPPARDARCAPASSGRGPGPVVDVVRDRPDPIRFAAPARAVVGERFEAVLKDREVRGTRRAERGLARPREPARGPARRSSAKCRRDVQETTRILHRRVAATPRPRRGCSVVVAAPSRIVRGGRTREGGCVAGPGSRLRRGHDVDTSPPRWRTWDPRRGAKSR